MHDVLRFVESVKDNQTFKQIYYLYIPCDELDTEQRNTFSSERVK